MKLVQWIAGAGGRADSGIRVPWVVGKPCLHSSPWPQTSAHSCTRNAGHTGRHMAYSVTGRVMGVWS